MMSKTPTHLNLPEHLSKNLPRGKKMPSTLSPLLVLLARKSLFSVLVYLFCPFRLSRLLFVAILTKPTKKKKKSPRMGQLLRAPPTR
jgi:hypothetical protein